MTNYALRTYEEFEIECDPTRFKDLQQDNTFIYFRG